MSRDNGTFLLSTHYYTFIECLTDKQTAILFKNIFLHQMERETLPMDDATLVAFKYITARLDENDVRYAEKCAKNKQAVAERWRREKDKNTNTDVYECIQLNTNDTTEYHNDNDNDNGNDNGNENVNVNGFCNLNKGKRRTFVPPTLTEVKEYCQERNNNVNPESFIDFYESKGWMVGKNKMKDWKAAVRTWEKNDYSRKGGKVEPEPISDEEYYADLRRQFETGQIR